MTGPARLTPTFARSDTWDVLIDMGGYNVLLQLETEDAAAAEEIAEFLSEKLPPLLEAKAAYDAERRAAHMAEIDARHEAERPARERRERERAGAVASAPRVTAARCPECDHVADPDEFSERGYECSTDGSTGRGDEGRRCDQCNRFRARVSDHTCPSCEQPVEPEEILAVEFDGELVAVEPSS